MLQVEDRQLLEAMRRQGGVTVRDCVRIAEVTPNAVRFRLQRLMSNGLVRRSTESQARGRPKHSYSLTTQGQMLLGQNYAELAMTLWQELKSYEDRSVGMKLLRRVADKMAEGYRRQMPGIDVAERMGDLQKLLADRGVDAELDQRGKLPVLRQHSCPYHDLAQVDRTVCGIERRMLEKAINSELKLSQCRLDGHMCCEFEVRAQGEPAESVVGVDASD